MNKHPHPIPSRISRQLARAFALVAFAAMGAGAFAQPQPQQDPQVIVDPQPDPPARVAAVTAMQGTVVFAPAGETEWTDLPRNRPITKGDRIWTDDGARAELNLGSSVLHMNQRTFVEVVNVDDNAVQLSVNEGTVNARARELRAGDNFEIATPQLAMRATQPGDWRIDVDPQQAFTRITAHDGVAVLYGSGGNVQQVVAGQQAAFAGRDLAQVARPPAMQDDGFDRWAMDRNRAEDQSIAARYIPRDVVAYPELDNNGTWASDPNYGTVWYPQVPVADWAPYRYGHWENIAPWGWTWIDDAPWGFAPFHYGRWAVIGARWAWVPGPLGRHPVYAPALVAFVGGGGPSIGWYPLAPGEIWRPYWNASPVYVRNVNRYLVTDSRFYNTGTHFFMRHPDAITTVRVDDFNRGRAVQSRWTRLHAQDLGRMQATIPPTALREAREARRDFPREQARLIQRDQRQDFRQEQRQERQEQHQPDARRYTQPQGLYQQPVQREPQRQQFVQQRQQFVQQQQREVQRAQRVEAIRQQQAVREVQREQRALPAPQQRTAPQPRHEERAAQREAQRGDEGRGHGRRYE